MFPDYLLASVAFVFVCILIGAALFPPRLAQAAAELRTGKEIRGGLIAHNDGAWYVVTSRHHYVAIDDSLIASPVGVAAKPRPRLRPVFEYAWRAIR